MKQRIMPTLRIRITAVNADSFIPRSVMVPKICANEAKILNITNTAAHIDSKRTATKTKAAKIQQHNIIANDDLNVIYCSQKIKGIPKNTN